MKFKSIKHKLVAALCLTAIPAIAKDEGVSFFDGNLALVEIISSEPFDATGDGRFTVQTKPRVHNLKGRVIEVYDGSQTALNARFPMTPPPYLEGDPVDLTHAHLAFDGIADTERINVGARGILFLFARKNFDYRQRNHNPYHFPDHSIFFRLTEKPVFTFDKVFPETFAVQKEWAEWIKSLNELTDEDPRVEHLRSGIGSDNTLISVSAVHLFKRLYPDVAEEYFDEAIFAPETPFYARLAMDHEFCLARGQAWIDGEQIKLNPILEAEAPNEAEGAGALFFRRQMTENGSWIGGRGEGE